MKVFGSQLKMQKQDVIIMGVQLAAGVLANPANATKMNGLDVRAVVRDCAQIVTDVLIENNIMVEGLEPAPVKKEDKGE